MKSGWRGNPSQRLEAGLQRQAHSSVDVERSCPTLRIKKQPQTVGRIFKKRSVIARVCEHMYVCLCVVRGHV